MRVLVKIGGAQLESPGPRTLFAQAVREARAFGHELILVHGGGPTIGAMSRKLGLSERRVQGLRVTDSETAEVVLGALAGVVNRNLVKSLVDAGVDGVGLTGADGRAWTARKHTPDGTDLGFVGRVDQVRPAFFLELLAKGYVPVVAPLAPLAPGSPGDASHFYNVNADQAAAPLAHALEADALLFLTDVPGLLDGENQLVPTATPETCARLERAGVLEGGMLPKVQAALYAAGACPRAIVKIAPGDRPCAVLAGLEDHVGTQFCASETVHGEKAIDG
ncbi:MAG: acetylglutamate kinase [bacterium]|nr:acetylglutamate kinase [bacterium]